MNQEQATPSESPEQSLDQRAAAIAAKLSAPADPPESPEPSTEGDAPPTEPATPANDTPVEEPPPAAASGLQNREQRIQAMQAREKDRQAKRQQWEQQRQRDEQLQRLQAERDALEQKAKLAESFEKNLSSEEGFFELAQKANVSPEKLASFIRDTLSDPTRAAAHKAQQAVAPEVAKVQAEMAALRARLEQQEQAIAQREAAAAEHAARAQVIAQVAQYEHEAPHTARYLKTFGPEQFLELATSVGRALPEGAGAQALYDAIEIQLEQLAAVYQAAPLAKSKPIHASAGAKATHATVSNRAASQRASVVEEPDISGLQHLDERANRLKKLLGGVG